MNIFKNPKVAGEYDLYYISDFGSKVDKIEKELITKLIADIPRTNMLELGCGTGHWTAFFEEQGFQIIATDNSEAMLSLARKKNLNAEFKLADAQTLPFPKHSFDFIATITMLEFVDEPNEVFKEIYRTLKPGGWLLTGCLNANSVIGKNKTGDEVFKHGKFFTPSELEKKLKLFGKPEINSAVFLSPDFKLLDKTGETKNTDPVFIAALVQKNKIK